MKYQRKVSYWTCSSKCKYLWANSSHPCYLTDWWAACTKMAVGGKTKTRGYFLKFRCLNWGRHEASASYPWDREQKTHCFFSLRDRPFRNVWDSRAWLIVMLGGAFFWKLCSVHLLTDSLSPVCYGVLSSTIS